MEFQGEKYKSVMEEIIQDIFYTNTTYRTRVTLIRQLAEILVKKIINYIDKPNKRFVLGNFKTDFEKIDLENKTGDFLQSAINQLREDGNKRSHTTDLTKTESSEYDSCIDALYRLIAYFFIQYFKKHPFGEDKEMRFFSILPPKIRRITLEELLKAEPKNVFIWHKLCLSLLKENGKESALSWLESNKNILKDLSTTHDKYNFDQFLMCQNTHMYIHLKLSIEFVYNQRSSLQVPIYSTFEESLEFYQTVISDKEQKKLLDNVPELKNLIDFLFQGRKKIFNKTSVYE